MITNLFNNINKRKHSYKTYELSSIHQYLEKTLSSPLIREGNVSLKIVVTNKQIKKYITIPTCVHYPLNKTEFNNVPNKLTTYQAELSSDNFFTLNLLSQNSIEHMIKDIAEVTSENEYFVINLVAKRIRSKARMFTDQYERFVKGVENPSSNPIVSKIQQHYAESNDEGITLPLEIMTVIENKITDNHFKFQLFFGISYKEKSKEELVEGLLGDILDGYSHLNAFTLEKINFDDEVFLTDELLFQYSKQYISLMEICSLAHGYGDKENEADIKLPETEIEPVIPSQENTNITDNTQSNETPITEAKTPIKQTLNNMPSLDLLPKQIETNENDVDKKIPDRIKNALKRVKIVSDAKDVKVIDFKVGDSLIKTTINIPNNKNFSDIKKKSEDIQVALGSETLSVVQGEIPDSVSLFIPRKERQPIYLRTLLQTHEFMEFAKNNPLPFVVGKDPLGTVVTADLNKLTHLLVSGQTDSGKSVWLNQMILTLLMMRNPSELMMYLIDPKQVEFEQFRDFPQVVDVIDDMKKANNLLEKLTNEMEKRYTTMKKGGAKKITAYNEKYPENKLPYIVVVIDEYADLKTVNPVVDDYLARLGQKARGAGIHLVIATQRPDRHVIEKTTANNLPSKISFRLNDNSSYTTVFGTGIPFILNGYGHGVMRLNGQVKDFEQFQGAIVSIDANEEEEVFDRIKKSFKGEKIEANLETLPMEIEEFEEVIEEEPIDKLKRIIANTGETRTGKLQKELAIGMDKVLSLMQELVDEKWLYKHAARSKGYELIASNEELNKWRDEPIEDVDQNSDDVKVYEKENSDNNANQVKQYTEDELNKLIDEALDNKDKETFKKYSKLLKELKDKNKEE